MELRKFKCESDAFAKRLDAVIRGEINTFIADGGIHPESIDVKILRDYRIGDASPTYILDNVEVSFVL